jgi:hypothetical protein
MKNPLLFLLIIGVSFNSVAQNIGINVSPALTRLHVKGTGTGTQILLEENAGSMLRISNEPTSTGPFIGTTSNHKLSFVANNLVRGLFETNGNFGIGVTSAQKPLSVGGGAVIDQNNQNTGTSANILSFGSNSAEGLGSNRGAGVSQFGLDFYTAGNKRLSIANGGNIGIGTDNPQANLDIMVGNNRNIRFKNDLVPSLEITSTNINDGLAGILRFRNALEVMPSTDGSRAGKLDVRNTSGTPTITLDGATGNIQANNMPAFGMKEEVPFLNVNGNSTQNVVLAQANVNFPSSGTAHITAHCLGTSFSKNNNPSTPATITLEFKIDLYDGNNNFIATLKKQELKYNIDYEIPVLDVPYNVPTQGNYIIKYTLYKSNYGPEGWLETSKIMVSFYPNALTMN